VLPNDKSSESSWKMNNKTNYRNRTHGRKSERKTDWQTNGHTDTERLSLEWIYWSWVTEVRTWPKTIEIQFLEIISEPKFVIVRDSSLQGVRPESSWITSCIPKNEVIRLTITEVKWSTIIELQLILLIVNSSFAIWKEGGGSILRTTRFSVNEWVTIE